MKKAAWIIPSFIEGSGGYRTVFQHVNAMAENYKCDVYVYDSGDYKSSRDLTARARKLYGNCNCRFFLGYDHLRETKETAYDIIVATSWLTADLVYQYKGAAKKVYFVQDYEPMFYPAGNQYLEAAGTYEMGFYHITIGRWLAQKLQKSHGAKVGYYDFCADKKIYRCISESREHAVCFIYQPEKPRRAGEIGLRALKIIKQVRPDIKIYIYGSAKKKIDGLECEHLGLISTEACNQLYNRCRVGLCISASNPSRIPFEMMAAGLPVVDIHAENNLFDYPDGTVYLAQCRPEAIAQAILNLFDDEQLYRERVKAGLEFMEHRDIQTGLAQFMELIKNLSLSQEQEAMAAVPAYTEKAVAAGEDIRKFVQTNTASLLERRGWKNNYYIRKIPGIKKLGRWMRGTKNE